MGHGRSWAVTRTVAVLRVTPSCAGRDHWGGSTTAARDRQEELGGVFFFLVFPLTCLRVRHLAINNRFRPNFGSRGVTRGLGDNIWGNEQSIDGGVSQTCFD